jgi:Epoxide hydrolase N terminus
MSARTEISAIRPFTIETPESELQDLRQRIAATRWPEKELVPDHSQGVQLETIQELARYWSSDYDWRACEAKLNALPQFMTEIDVRLTAVGSRAGRTLRQVTQAPPRISVRPGSSLTSRQAWIRSGIMRKKA